MKVFSKILILILFVTAAIGAVMIYAKTQVEPPVAIHKIDPYQQYLQQAEEQLSNETSILHKESQICSLLNCVSVFVRENKMSSLEGNAHIDNLVQIYTPAFIDYAFDRFNQSVWNRSDLKMMDNAAQTLQDIHYFDNTPVIAHSQLESLKLIKKVISDYYAAQKIATRKKFYSVENSEKTISQAIEYANHKYLSHCTALREALYEVRGNLAESHRQYVASQIALLAQNNSVYYYENTLIPHVQAKIDEYDDAAQEIYNISYNEREETRRAFIERARYYIDNFYNY